MTANHHLRLDRRHLLGISAMGIVSLRNGAAMAQPRLHRRAIAPALYELAYSPGQDAVFVVSAGGFTADAPPSKVLRLDPRTLEIRAEIPLPHKGFGMTLDEAGKRLYVGHAMNAAVSAIDIEANRVAGTTPPLEPRQRGQDGEERHPHGLREILHDPATQRLFMPGLSFEGSVLFVVDARSMTLERTIPDLGPTATGIAFDAGRKRVFVSNMRGEIVTLDSASLAATGRFAAGGAEQPLNLLYDKDTGHLLAVDQGHPRMRSFQERFIPGFASRHPGNRLLVLDAGTGALVKEVPTGEGPVALLRDAQRRRVYVTDRAGGSVSVFDAVSYETIATVPLPPHPTNLALDERSGAVFVSVKQAESEPRGTAESVARIEL